MPWASAGSSASPPVSRAPTRSPVEFHRDGEPGPAASARGPRGCRVSECGGLPCCCESASGRRPPRTPARARRSGGAWRAEGHRGTATSTADASGIASRCSRPGPPPGGSESSPPWPASSSLPLTSRSRRWLARRRIEPVAGARPAWTGREAGARPTRSARPRQPRQSRGGCGGAFLGGAGRGRGGHGNGAHRRGWPGLGACAGPSATAGRHEVDGQRRRYPSRRGSLRAPVTGVSAEGVESQRRLRRGIGTTTPRSTCSQGFPSRSIAGDHR